LRSEVEAAFSELRDAQPLGGGCISNTTKLTTVSGNHACLKWGRHGDLPHGIFTAENHGLAALRHSGTVRVPHVIAQSESTHEFDWLLLEWLEPALLTRESWHELGSTLAKLHHSSHEHFGWNEPNFIGSLPQANTWSADWPDFWRTQRLAPQLELTARSGAMRDSHLRRCESLLNALHDLIAEGNTDRPSLLHGDLWNGNVHGTAGSAALIDPSVYYGHREVDLAMAALFGGFDSAFWRAYDEGWPLQPGWEQRRLVYQLYYLLVHVNLFGGSYVSSALAAVGKLGF
jgi:fructosamine-3-kinase